MKKHQINYVSCLKIVFIAFSLAVFAFSANAQDVDDTLEKRIEILNEIYKDTDIETPGFSVDSVSDILEIKIEPSYKFEKASHVANGAAIRNRTAATIHLRGIPLSNTTEILTALLYLNFSDNNASVDTCYPILFNANLVKATKTADNPDPCWAMAMNHSYVAQVTQYVDIKNPNQDYRVVLPFACGTSTSGENPWGSASILPNPDAKIEGATLVVVYRNENTDGPLYIYDKLNNSMFHSTAFFYLIHPPISTTPYKYALFTMVGADGQRGYSHYDFTSERTYFDQRQIAGPRDPATPMGLNYTSDSDWNGSDGWPLNQLWDTHTHYVQIEKPDVSEVKYISGGDCLVPVAFILDMF